MQLLTRGPWWARRVLGRSKLPARGRAADASPDEFNVQINVERKLSARIGRPAGEPLRDGVEVVGRQGFAPTEAEPGRFGRSSLDSFRPEPTGSHSFHLRLGRMRLMAIFAPILFLVAVEAMSIFVLRAVVHSPLLEFVVIAALLFGGAIPFALRFFRVIEQQHRDRIQAAVLLDSVSDLAIFMLDSEGRVLTWDRGAQQIHGFKTEEIVGQPFAVFFPEEAREAGEPQSRLDATKRDGSSQYAGWRVRQDGTRFWAEVLLSTVVDHDGRLLGFSEVTRDATERRISLEQIDRLNAELGARVRELGTANAEIERRNHQLTAANGAIAAISSALDPGEVLQRITDSARDLVSARYGALGVADDNGRIVQFITSGITPEQREAVGPIPQGHGLLGALIVEQVPLRLASIQDDPRSAGFPHSHPPMTTLLGVPIVFHGTAVGNLYMTDKTPRDPKTNERVEAFTEEDQHLLELLANHAAVAITNARLYEGARAARDRLEIWSQQLEAEVVRRTKQIEAHSRELTRRVLQAQEEERKRIARELHDETAQSLSTMLINIDLLDQTLPSTDSSSLRQGLDRLRSLAQRTLDETRALSHDLRPTILDDVGLAPAIEWLAAQASESFPGNIQARTHEPRQPLDDDVELALFRIAQEALTNAVKYSQATLVEIDLDFEDHLTLLTVRDNGRGFDPEGVEGPTRYGRLGLYGMRERVELVAGEIEIESAVDRGTRIEVRVPLDDRAAHGKEEDEPC